jgi:energy-converting hydrogenase A subunit R
MLIPAAKEMLEFIRCLMPAYIVSTSYQQYVCALCDAINFPFENVYCTLLDLDKHEITDDEKTELKQLSREIVQLPALEIPPYAQSLNDFPSRMQKTVKRLDEIFWDQILSMRIGKMLFEVNPIGGREKAAAIKDILLNLKGRPQNVMYVGDSITDVSAFKLVRDAGGLTVSFNGNAYAVREAEVAVLSKNAAITAVLANMFIETEKESLLNTVKNWKSSEFRKFYLKRLGKRFSTGTSRGEFPRVKVVTESNLKKLASDSAEFRKKLRGETIGKLG